LDLLERLPPPIDEARRCGLLIALGEAQRSAGEPLKAQKTLIYGAEIAQAWGLVESLVRAALQLADMTSQLGLSVAPGLLQLLEDALERLGPEDSHLRAKTLAGLASLLGVTGSQQLAIPYVEEGVAMSRRLSDPKLIIPTLLSAIYVYQGPQHVKQRLSWATEIQGLAQGARVGEALVYARSWLVICLLELGDMAAFDAELEAFTRAAEELQQPFPQCVAAICCATRVLMKGDFAEGERLSQQAFSVGQRMQMEGVAAGVFGMQMFALHRERGQLKELEPVLRLFLQQHGAKGAWPPGLAVIYAELGRTEEARAEFEHLARYDFADLPHDALWMGSLTFLAEICAFLGDKARAITLYELLLPFTGYTVVIGNSAVACFGALSRYLGTLATTLERWDDAVRHFEDALFMNARMEAWPSLAHTQSQYATMLLSRDLSGDRDRAFALLDSALATARRLGMRGLEQRVTVVLNKQPLGGQSGGAA
jgi:tetratricopeptide (TPR) repeat protein